MQQLINPSWFRRDTVEVAKDMIGCCIEYQNQSLIVTETEAYRGSDDPASHAYQGKTARNSVMYGDPGIMYVYLVYGIHHCINFVTETQGQPGAVLIRSVYDKRQQSMIDGPGRTAKHMGIDISHNNNCFTNYMVISKEVELGYASSERIGIKKGIDLPWRFKASIHPH